jgi:dienelactone hydrolase
MKRQRSYLYGLVLCSFAGALAACADSPASSNAASVGAVGAEEPQSWAARGDVVGSYSNRVPNIPIVGKTYQGSFSAYALEPAGGPDVGYRGAVIVNPGAAVKSGDSVTFAEALAKRGYVAYVANNPEAEIGPDQGGPITGPVPLLVGNLVPEFARDLSSNPREVGGLPEALIEAHEAWNRSGSPRLVAFGHSLGGAVLGSAAAVRDAGLSRIILMGVDELVDAPFPFGIRAPAAGDTGVPLVFVRGEHDGLAEAAKISALSAKYTNSTVLTDVSGVNHFCIIDGNPGDPSLGAVGAPGKRAEDNPSTLPDVAACVDATISALEGLLGG